MSISAGQQLWVNTAVVTVAASPLLSGWLDVRDVSGIYPVFTFTTGTSTHSIEGSFDRTNVDSAFTYSAPTTATPFLVQHPYIRWKTVQTSADATVSKVMLKTCLMLFNKVFT